MSYYFSACCELSITFLGLGSMTMVPSLFLPLNPVGFYCLSALAVTTSFVNIVFAAMITIRLVIHQRQMKKLLGQAYTSPYNRTISIIVESCMLIVVTNLVFLSLLLDHQVAAYIPSVLMIHASVSSLSLLQSCSFKTYMKPRHLDR